MKPSYFSAYWAFLVYSNLNLHFFLTIIFSVQNIFFLISAHKDCPQCDESFFGMNAKRSLDRHMKTHNKVTKGKIMTEKNYVQGKLSNCFFFLQRMSVKNVIECLKGHKQKGTMSFICPSVESPSKSTNAISVTLFTKQNLHCVNTRRNIAEKIWNNEFVIWF